MTTVFFQQQQIPDEVFDDRVRRAIGALRTLGLRDGDVLALMMRNSPELLELMVAARALGAYWCPINWHFKSDELRHILRDSGASLLVIDAPLWAERSDAAPHGLPVLFSGAATGPDTPTWPTLRDAAAPDRGPDAPPRGAMLYTSGTTGQPKGIRRQPSTPEQAARSLERLRQVIGCEAGMRALLSAPMYHSAPNSFAMAVAQHDGLLVLEDRFDAEQTLALIERHAITHAYLVPTMYVRLLRLPEQVRRRHDLSSLRFVSSTGSPCPPEVKRAMIEWWGPVIHEAYGSSELGYMTLLDSEQALRKPGSAGLPLAGVEIRILDADGSPMTRGSAGMIYVKPELLADFSYNQGQAARAAMERDGFLTMGDIGYLDDDGFLFIVDRAADMVISGGVNIYPAEIEAVLQLMPGVADCAVFGIPDAEFGEALAAAVMPAAGAQLDAAAVQAYLRQRLAGYKVPAVVDFHAEMPREDTGKIFKRKLREPYWAGAARRI
ncbi:AMP-binding protein [Piscinibacter sakaiensis]|uniref:AMP-binding protein n=1 Tax=Piscinibacter sakaiensis TaxID=1547922 RepID=UPI003AAEE394